MRKIFLILLIGISGLVFSLLSTDIGEAKDYCKIPGAESFCQGFSGDLIKVSDCKYATKNFCDGKDVVQIGCNAEVGEFLIDCFCDSGKSKFIETCQYGCKDGKCLSEEEAKKAAAAPTPPAPTDKKPAAKAISVRLENPLEAETFGELIDNIINFIFTIALAIVPIMLIIAGILFVTAAGDPNQIAQARNLILYVLIGFIIILLSKGLIAFLRQVLEVKEKETYLQIFIFSLIWLKEIYRAHNHVLCLPYKKFQNRKDLHRLNQ